MPLGQHGFPCFPSEASGNLECTGVRHVGFVEETECLPPHIPHGRTAAPGTRLLGFSTVTITTLGRSRSWELVRSFHFSVFSLNFSFFQEAVWWSFALRKGKLAPWSQLAKPQDGAQSSAPTGRCGDRPRRGPLGSVDKQPPTWESRRTLILLYSRTCGMIFKVVPEGHWKGASGRPDPAGLSPMSVPPQEPENKTVTRDSP